MIFVQKSAVDLSHLVKNSAVSHTLNNIPVVDGSVFSQPSLERSDVDVVLEQFLLQVHHVVHAMSEK